MPIVEEPPTKVPTMLPATNNEPARAPPTEKSRTSFTLDADQTLAATITPNIRKTPTICVVLNVAFTLLRKSYYKNIKESPENQYSPGLSSLISCAYWSLLICASSSSAFCLSLTKESACSLPAYIARSPMPITTDVKRMSIGKYCF